MMRDLAHDFAALAAVALFVAAAAIWLTALI